MLKQGVRVSVKWLQLTRLYPQQTCANKELILHKAKFCFVLQ